jgi:hypothetical protein
MRNKRFILFNQQSAAPASPLLTGLSSYWKLDEASGNRLDSVGSRTMTPQNGVSAIAGKISNCAAFAGTGNDQLVTGIDASLTAIDWSLGFSVTGWMYIPGAYTARTTVLSKFAAGNADWALFTNSVASLRMSVFDSVSGSSDAINTTSLVADTWYFFAGRYNPSTKKAEFSLNGGSWNLGAALTNVPKNVRQILIINGYAATYGVCRVDEVGLWTRYLSDAEVTELYNGGAGLAYPF